MFDPSWFLINRVSSPDIDNQLSDRSVKAIDSVSTLKGLREAVQAAQSKPVSENGTWIWLMPDTIMEQRAEVTSSSVQIAQSRTNSQCLLVDTIVPDTQAQLSMITKDIRDLARILSKSDPQVFGLLRCVGVIREAQSSDKTQSMKFELLFSIPDGLRTPTSLGTFLRTSEGHYSLNERFDLTRSLASSIMYIHSSKFVHKNIKIRDNDCVRQWQVPTRSTLLVGFEKFRPIIDGRTSRSGDSFWEKDLYRHPSRQVSSRKRIISCSTISTALEFYY